MSGSEVGKDASLVAFFSSIANQLSISQAEIENVIIKMEQTELTLETLCNGSMDLAALQKCIGIEKLEDASLILAAAKRQMCEGGTHIDGVTKGSAQRQLFSLKQGSSSFDDVTDGNQQLDVLSLSRMLATVYNWETLGVNLGIKMHKLEEIRLACHGDLEMCKNRLYDTWLRQNTNPSWKEVVDALEQMEEKNLADKIRRIFVNPTTEECTLQHIFPLMRQASIEKYGSSKSFGLHSSSIDSDSGQDAVPNLLVMPVPIPVTYPSQLTLTGVMPPANFLVTTTPSVTSNVTHQATAVLPVNISPSDAPQKIPDKVPKSDYELVELLRTMTVEDAQEIEVDCKVFNADTNKLIQRTTAPLTRDIKIRRRPHPRVQEYSSDTVPIGTNIRLEITPDSECYLYLFNIGTSGKTSLLLPNEYGDTNHFYANQTYYLPGQDFGFEITGPAGKETIQILAFSREQSTLGKLVENPVHNNSKELYRDITVRRKRPTAPAERKGFTQVQFDVK